MINDICCVPLTRGVATGWRTALCLVIFTCLQTHGSGVKDSINGYFTRLKETFAAAAQNPAVQKTRIADVDRYFVAVLKKNQVFHSLLKTNSKGIIISEAIRGKAPSHDYRNIANQQWYQFIARAMKDYHGFLEEGGRYYLFWAAPVIMTSGAGKQRFNGVIAVKIDLWDCFHRISGSIEKPFLVRLNDKSLYSHKWKKELASTQEPLDIPGVSRISLFCLPEQAESIDQIDSAAAGLQTLAGHMPVTDTGIDEAKKPVLMFNAENYIYIIIAVVLLVVVLAFALIRLLVWVKYKRLEIKIDKENIL